MFPIDPHNLPRPHCMTRPERNRPDSHRPIMKLFRLGPHKSGLNPTETATKLEPDPKRCLHLHHFPAVCLAACKYQHRKWCHSGDAVGPVWIKLHDKTRVEPGSKMAPRHYSLHCLYVGLWAQLCVTSPLLLSDLRSCTNIRLNHHLSAID